jgi:hypothetical protein
MARLYFLLSNPKLLFSKFDGAECWQLGFKNVRLARGMGQLLVDFEAPNHDPRQEGEFQWKTVDLSGAQAENEVILRMGGTVPDAVVVEFPPRLIAGLTLSPESFSPLFTINRNKQYMILDVNLKYPATIPRKFPFNREKETMENEIVELPVDFFSIALEEFPIPESYLPTSP